MAGTALGARVPRREFLRGAAVGGIGLAGAAVLGCAAEQERAPVRATPAVSAAEPTPRATATPALPVRPPRRSLTIAPRATPLGDGPELDAVLEWPAEADGPLGCVVICHPHPLYGGDRDSNVVVALRDGALGAGLAALRFDFRGVGRSAGSHDGGPGELDDVRAALAAAAAQPEIDGARVALAGYSFGAGAAAGVTVEAVAAGELGPAALVLVALPLPAAEEVRAQLEARSRERFALDGYTRPLLLATGEHDTISPPEAMAVVAEQRTPDGAVTETLVAPGADHFWLGSEPLLVERAGAFLARALAG